MPGYCNAGVSVCLCVYVSVALYHTITSLNVGRLLQNIGYDTGISREILREWVNGQFVKNTYSLITRERLIVEM